MIWDVLQSVVCVLALTDGGSACISVYSVAASGDYSPKTCSIVCEYCVGTSLIFISLFMLFYPVFIFFVFSSNALDLFNPEWQTRPFLFLHKCYPLKTICASKS